MKFTVTDNHVQIRLEPQDMPHVAAEQLKKERAKREELERQMALVLEKLKIQG